AVRPRAAMIAPMRSRVACVAVIGLVAAAGCNEGLSPTPACPRGFVGICGTATVRGTLPDSTQGLFIVAYTTFPESIQALLTFQPLPPPAVLLPPSGDSTLFYTLPLPGLSAQETAVLYGSMRDSSGQPLRATVRVVNGAAASVADAQGRYQLSVPAGLVIVRVGFLGYRSLDDTLTLAAGIRSSAT